MKMEALTRALLLSALILALPAIASAAGHIAPTGVTTKKASQLIVWYDQSEEDAFEGFTLFQVTNANTTTGVNIHVQVFADDSGDSTDLCREHDFTDTLTPMDTVLYVIGRLDFIETDVFGSGTDFGGDNNGNTIPIDLDGTRGFIVVTAVNQSTLPRQAISHNYLFGSVTTWWDDGTGLAQGLEAMGREAVNVATGALAADSVILDGVNNALRILQPSLLMFDFNDGVIANEDESNVVSIAFSDNYSDPSGEYRAEPATAVWDPLMFDQFENGTSCQQHIQTCFVTIGLNNEWETVIDGIGGYTDIRLCPAVDIDGTDGAGWVKIAVSGLSGLANNIGALGLDDDGAGQQAVATWMFAE